MDLSKYQLDMWKFKWDLWKLFGWKVEFHLKSKLQVWILVPQNCKLHQSLSNSPKNEKNLWHIHFKVLKRPSISRRFAIFNYFVLIFKQFLIKNSESVGNRRFSRSLSVKPSGQKFFWFSGTYDSLQCDCSSLGLFAPAGWIFSAS